MTQPQYEQWVKDGGTPATEKWILDSILKNTKLLSSNSRKADSQLVKKRAELLSNTNYVRTS